MQPNQGGSFQELLNQTQAGNNDNTRGEDDMSQWFGQSTFNVNQRQLLSFKSAHFLVNLQVLTYDNRNGTLFCEFLLTYSGYILGIYIVNDAIIQYCCCNAFWYFCTMYDNYVMFIYVYQMFSLYFNFFMIICLIGKWEM